MSTMIGDPYRGTVIVEVLRVGDTVDLKSDGPDMTVERVRSDGLIECVWFDETGPDSLWQGPFRATFPPEALRKVDE